MDRRRLKIILAEIGLFSVSPLCFAFQRPMTSSCLSESCAKIGDGPKSPVPILAAWCRRLATITSELKLRSRSKPVRVSVALLRNTLYDFEWLSRKC